MSLHVEGQGARIELVNVEKRFGSVVAVSNTNLEVRSGEFLTLLGPSGCGKTTTLRMIGGFEYPSGGSILIDGVDVANLPPYRRPINTVFQQYALFPHMSVARNIGYGLEMSGVGKSERNRRVARAFATCLDAADVTFAILGVEESCTGDPARRMGNDYVFQILAGGNIETLDRYGMREHTIVTACPHCFNTIGNEYGQLGGQYRIVHHSVYLRELIASGRLRLAGDGSLPGRSVTLHDSCYMARYNDVVAEPREIGALLQVAALHVVAARMHDLGDGAHADTANADDVHEPRLFRLRHVHG